MNILAAYSQSILPMRERQHSVLERIPGAGLVKQGKRLLSFSDNDYLGLSFHPALQQAAVEAIEQYGCSAGASRLVTGNHPLYEQLERALAQYKGVEASLVFGSGYLANIGVIPALGGPEDLILADRLCHASLLDGIRLSGATFQRFQHNEMGHLQQQLLKWRSRYRRCVIVTESVFSMDGDKAPLAAIHALAEAHDAALLVDDAHGFGVLDQGRGGVHEAGLAGYERVVQIGTFSKAAGSYGGYVAASAGWIRHFTNYARTAIYTTGLPPAVIAANLAALRIIQAQPELTAKPLEHAQYFTQKLAMPLAQSAIVPIIIGTDADALNLSHVLEDEGFLVVAIRPPTVPEGTARLRLAFSASHSKEDIERLAERIRCHLPGGANV